MIANRKLLGLDAAPEYVGAVVDKETARPIRRSVEWNLDLDASLRSEDLYALVRRQLRAACENRLAGGKIENRRAQPVSVKLRIALKPANYADRFLLEQKAGNLNWIAADVHQSATTPVLDVADVGGVAIEVAEGAHYGAQITDLARAHDLPSA